MFKPLSPATSHVQKSSRIWQRGLRSCSVHQYAKHVYIQYSNMASHASPWKPSGSKASLCLSDCRMRSCTKGLPSTSWPYWKVTQGLQSDFEWLSGWTTQVTSRHSPQHYSFFDIELLKKLKKWWMRSGTLHFGMQLPNFSHSAQLPVVGLAASFKGLGLPVRARKPPLIALSGKITELAPHDFKKGREAATLEFVLEQEVQSKQQAIALEMSSTSVSHLFKSMKSTSNKCLKMRHCLQDCAHALKMQVTGFNGNRVKLSQCSPTVNDSENSAWQPSKNKKHVEILWLMMGRHIWMSSTAVMLLLQSQC